MSDTTHLSLPYLEAAQAQKHVTVNEALRRLDALVHLSVLNATLTTPPTTPEEGDRYIVGTGASGAWNDEGGHVACWVDGAWMFLVPQVGWRAFNEAVGEFVRFTGGAWVAETSGGGGAVSAHGAAMSFHVLEADHTITAGATNDTSFVIPDRAIVLGVTGRVLTTIGGATSWKAGVAADDGRYGTGIGAASGSTLIGPSGPVTYWSPTALRLTATGGSFTGGVVRLAIHYVLLTVPSA